MKASMQSNWPGLLTYSGGLTLQAEEITNVIMLVYKLYTASFSHRNHSCIWPTNQIKFRSVLFLPNTNKC